MSIKVIEPRPITGDRLVSSNAPTDTIPEYDPNAAYSPGANGAQGDRVVEGTEIYEAVAEVTGVLPSEGEQQEPKKWILVGSLNQWAVFNGIIGDPTESGEPMPVHGGNGLQFVIRPGRVVNALALLGIEGANEVRVEVISGGDVVYDTTRSLRSTVGINSYYAYFFEPVEQDTDAVFTGLPSYNADIRVTVPAQVDVVRCGLCVVGRMRDLGLLYWGFSTGIMSFSRRVRDEFGRVRLLKRDNAKLASFEVSVDGNRSNALARYLAKWDSEPLLWIGAEQYEPTIIYGFYEDWRLVYPHLHFHNCTLDIVGLT
ncbi:MAG TPA: hypothetical protein DHW46_11815 [Halomonas sp.]|nr:hypothetical protein [Halomonas sp.]HCL24260.1 hypothetical protein [Halomonas sp.]